MVIIPGATAIAGMVGTADMAGITVTVGMAAGTGITVDTGITAVTEVTVDTADTTDIETSSKGGEGVSFDKLQIPAKVGTSLFIPFTERLFGVMVKL